MRESYSQFVQQELYSSAFGKGDREFGWTFYPMPGSDRLIPGVRTTYAVMILPEETTAVILETKGCYFKRNAVQPDKFDSEVFGGTLAKDNGCTAPSTLLVPLPNGGNPNNNGFSVSSVAYRDVPKGAKAVVTIVGDNFSSQTGVLIDGVALTQSIGLGQPFVRDDSDVGRAVIQDNALNKVKGSFERISSREIIATFEMGPDFRGTPTITLMAPGSSLTLNFYEDIKVIHPDISATQPKNLTNAPYIFGSRVGDSGGRETIVEGIDVFPDTASEDASQVLVKGKNLSAIRSLFVNGVAVEVCKAAAKPPGCFARTGTYISLHIQVSSQVKNIKLTMVTDLGTIDSSVLLNPHFKETKQSDALIPKFKVDAEKFTIDDVLQITCQTTRERGVEVLFEMTGKKFTEKTKAHLDGKDVPLEIDGTKRFFTLVKPKIKQTLFVYDSSVELQAQRLLIFKMPDKGCPVME